MYSSDFTEHKKQQEIKGFSEVRTSGDKHAFVQVHHEICCTGAPDVSEAAFPAKTKWDDINLMYTESLGNKVLVSFDPTTVISFALPKASDVRLAVYNVPGQEVQTVVVRSGS